MLASELDHRSQPFLGLYVMLLIPTLSFFALFGKGQMHLFINRFHSPSADLFFKQATNLGDPLFLAIIVALLLVIDWRKGLLMILFGTICGGMVGFVKAMLVDDMRPFKFFQYFNTPLHFVEGIRLHEYNTFPSGHTAIAFGTFFMLSLFVGRKSLSVLFFVLAVLVGYSRMYLSMHFLVDVVMGSIIGIVIAGSLYHFSSTDQWKRLVGLTEKQKV
ncbi:MAG: phosphatase PAP2 family protein [Bacteroidota bacterium]